MENFYTIKPKDLRKGLKNKDRLILSMDVPTKNQALMVLEELGNTITTVKIGLELIYNAGTEIIKAVTDSGYKVMLDAKLMDIPNTIAGALRGISKLGVDMVTLHTFGGPAMLKNAKEELIKASENKTNTMPLLFGVTVLTSLDNSDLNSFGFNLEYSAVIENLARIAIDNNIDGIICSPNEVSTLRKTFGNNFLIATPGIRLPDEETGDQKRFNTPEKALKDGADFIIVGRPILKSKNKRETVVKYLSRMEGK